MKHKVSAFLPRLKAHVGHGYVYGGTGVICTISLLKAREKQYGARMGDGYYCKLVNGVKDFTKGKCARWLGIWVADCSNMMQAIRRELGESIGSKSAHMLWETCGKNTGPLKTMPKIPGVLVFRNDGTEAKKRMGHTAMYVGEGKVVEAAGVTKGVIFHPLSAAWTHWGIPDWLTMDLPADGDPVPEPKPDEPIGGEETKPIYFVTTKDCCYLIHVAKRFGLADWRTITLEDGSKPNPLLMRPGMKLIVGYEIAPVEAKPVYFTTTKDMYKLIHIARHFTEKLGEKINWWDIRTKDGKIPNPLAIQIGMVLRIR